MTSRAERGERPGGPDLPGARRGVLLVLEGPEAVGKTTQVAGLVERLRACGLAVHAFREPGGTALGDEIRRLLLDGTAGDPTPAAEALLYMAARAQLVAEVRARLEAGTTVVLDRFFLSTYAYQVVGRGLPAERVRHANQLAVDGLVPDLTLLLTCPPAVAQRRLRARGALDRMERQTAAFHGRVASAFAAAAEPAWQQANPEVGPVTTIDADGLPAAVARRIDAAIASRWPETFRGLVESE